jgi:hypothetical protein
MARAITCTVLKVLSDYRNGRGDILRLQIVSWNNGEPKVEKRMYYLDDGGEEKTGRLKGLSHDDIQTILKEADVIDDILGKFKPKKGRG